MQCSSYADNKGCAADNNFDSGGDSTGIILGVTSIIEAGGSTGTVGGDAGVPHAESE